MHVSQLFAYHVTKPSCASCMRRILKPPLGDSFSPPQMPIGLAISRWRSDNKLRGSSPGMMHSRRCPCSEGIVTAFL